MSDRISDHRGPCDVGLNSVASRIWTHTHTHSLYFLGLPPATANRLFCGVLFCLKRVDAKGCVRTSFRAVLLPQAEVKLFTRPPSKHHCA